MQQQRQHQQQQQEQQQQQQYTAAYIQQAQAIWERMHMAAMGIKLPQSFDDVRHIMCRHCKCNYHYFLCKRAF